MPGLDRSGRAVASALMLALALPRLAGAAPANALTAPGGTTNLSLPSLPSAPPPAGVAVLARPGAEAAAWALAKETYARPSLRPVGLDEPRARVLVGDPSPSGAAQATRDLADERAGVHGDDGASRALLRSIAMQLNVRALVVVELGASGAPSARVFLADSGAFDAARYEPDLAPPPPVSIAPASPATDAGAPSAPSATSDGGMAPVAPTPPPSTPAPPLLHWSGAVASFERAYGAFETGAPDTRAPQLATSALPPPVPKVPESHPFYVSPWFWGAVGAAVFGGVAVYFATRDNTPAAIHLELQVPK